MIALNSTKCMVLVGKGSLNCGWRSQYIFAAEWQCLARSRGLAEGPTRLHPQHPRCQVCFPGAPAQDRNAQPRHREKWKVSIIVNTMAWPQERSSCMPLLNKVPRNTCDFKHNWEGKWPFNGLMSMVVHLCGLHPLSLAADMGDVLSFVNLFWRLHVPAFISGTLYKISNAISV